jgi:hypothetical protein
LIQFGEYPDGILERNQAQNLCNIAFLIFGREAIRNPRVAIYSPMLLSLIEREKKSWNQAIQEYSMASEGAAEVSRRIEKRDRGEINFPKEGTKIRFKIDVMQIQETKLILEWLQERMKTNKISLFNNEKDLLSCIKTALFKFYRLD